MTLDFHRSDSRVADRLQGGEPLPGLGELVKEAERQVKREILAWFDLAKPSAEDLKKRFGRGLFVQTDVSSDLKCKKLIDETMKKYGRIDTLVNNAGVNFVKPKLEMTVDDWDRVVNVDLRGTFLCSKYALENMVKVSQGSIIKTSPRCWVQRGVITTEELGRKMEEIGKRAEGKI